MSYEQIRLEREGAAATLRLAHPPVNVMTVRMMKEILAAVDEVEADPSIRVLVVRGEGKLFSAGASVEEHLPGRWEEMIATFRSLVERFLRMRLPVLCAAHGAALGGALEFAALSDLLLVQEGTRLALPEIKLGSLPPVAAALFPLMIGWKPTMQMVLTGEELPPERACRLGLVAAVLPKEGFEDRLRDWVERLLALSAPALRRAKAAVLGDLGRFALDSLRSAEACFRELMRTEDAVEGLRAFLEKRKPNWRHA